MSDPSSPQGNTSPNKAKIINNVPRKIPSNHRLMEKVVEEDECDEYVKLLAKRLRRYSDRMRNKIMYKIDCILLDKPYPDERISSTCTYCALQSPSPVNIEQIVEILKENGTQLYQIDIKDSTPEKHENTPNSSTD